jgi:ribose transport system permease protein
MDYLRLNQTIDWESSGVEEELGMDEVAEKDDDIAAEGGAGGSALMLNERGDRWRKLLGELGILGALLVMIAVFGVLRPDTFLSTENFTNILVQAAPLAAIAFGLTVVLVMGDFDLSVAAMSSLAGAVALYLMTREGIDWVPAVAVALLVGVVVGLGNGFLIAYAKNSSFIITLASGTILTGIEFTITNQETLFENVPQGYIDLGQGSIGGIRTLLIIAFIVFVACLVLLEKTELGRYMRAVGGNSEAARLTGLNVPRLRLTGFIIVAVAAAISGIMLTAQAGSSTPSGATGLLLPAYAAAFLGAAAFRPGEFNVAGTLVGVLILAVIQNGLTLMNADPAVINLVQGGILIAAVWVTRAGLQQRSA